MSDQIPVLGKLVPKSKIKEQTDLWDANMSKLEATFGTQLAAFESSLDLSEQALAAFMKPKANAFVLSRKFVMDLLSNHLKADYLIILNACSLGGTDDPGRVKGDHVVAFLAGEYENTDAQGRMHFKKIYSSTDEVPEHPGSTRVIITPFAAEDDEKQLVIQ